MALFFIYLIPLLLIKNEFHMADEYCFVVRFDMGKRIFDPFHILSFVNGYFWWFLATILGFKISAFRALQVTSSIMAAIGMVALMDLAIFWKLKWRDAFLFSLPVFLSNAFFRYATSAYPDAAAFGMGLVAVNLIIKAVASQESVLQRGYSKSFYISGLVSGFACLLHITFLTLVPGFIIGIVTRLRQCKRSLMQILRLISYYCLGVITILAAGYVFLFVIHRIRPDLVEFLDIQFLSNAKNKYIPFSRIITGAKTFMAIFFPGVHSSIRILDLLFNAPRLLASLVLLWLFYKVWKRRKENLAISSWIIPLIFSVVLLFLFMFIFNLVICRQYAAVGLSVFGPMFLATGISALKRKSTVFKVPMLIISLSFAFYMIFGIEGVIQILTHDSRPFRKICEKYDIHRPKIVQFPWNAEKSKPCPDCNYIGQYGAFGPSLSDVGL